MVYTHTHKIIFLNTSKVSLKVRSVKIEKNVLFLRKVRAEYEKIRRRKMVKGKFS